MDLKKAINDAGYTVPKFASKIGVVKGTIYNHLKGECLLSVRIAKRVKEELNKCGIVITLDEIFE